LGDTGIGRTCDCWSLLVSIATGENLPGQRENFRSVSVYSLASSGKKFLVQYYDILYQIVRGLFSSVRLLENYFLIRNTRTFDILAKAHVGVTPGIDFGRCGEGYLRFSYANSMEIIRKGLDRLERYLQEYGT